ncbi:copper resistance protein NlpE N-terminal domain-containing protein [Kushneria aurantia]|uniref:Copper resistance protein NlpE N-terminal domain-containing protein n=1 Tax=Kushneria aurantia TaxID=504092 RepID=A0ABV6G7G1_9GAMM|nr:copper resistance protein NlpE N-terminal domain-containing protein [Kushneria aurantia]
MQMKTLLAGSALLALLAGCAGTGGGQTSGGDSGMTSAAQQTRTYVGTLPCRSCDGIQLTVDLQGSEDATNPQTRTFELEADYQNHPQNPPAETYSGNWEVINGMQNNPQATVYELTPSGDGQVYYFEKVNPSTLELIDPQLRSFENGERLRLTLQQ